MSKVITKILLVKTALIFIFTVTTASASDYYIDTAASNANDNNSGSASSPWKTIQKGAAVAVAGDRVIVRAGTYTGKVLPSNSGNASAYISFIGEPGAVINGGGFTISQKRYIQVSGFKIQNVPGTGIAVIGPNASFIRILNNHTWNTGDSGISVWGREWGNDPAECNYACATDIVIEGNRVERANNPALGGGYNEHITIASGVQRVTIRKNTVTAGPPTGDPLVVRPGGEGIDLKEGVSDAWVSENEIYDMVLCRYGIYIDAGGSTWGYPQTYKTVPGWMRNIHVFRNKVINNDSHGIGFTSEGSGNADGVYIYNNLVVGQGTDGILIYDWGLPNRPNPPNPLPTATNIFVLHNTVTANARTHNWFGGIAVDHHFATNIIIRNNISFGQPNNIRLPVSPPGTVIDFNQTTDPMFVNAAALDYRLKVGSPAIDTGSMNLPVAVLSDFNGTNRPFGSGYDRGAYEYSVSVPPPPNGISYVSDLQPTSAINGWGPVEKDRSNGDSAQGDGRILNLNGTAYNKGIGVHAESELRYNLQAKCSQFKAVVGVDDEVTVSDGASIIFRISADGTTLWESPIMRADTTSLAPVVDLRGKNELLLSVTDAGDGRNSDHGDWANATVSCGDVVAPNPPSGLTSN